MSLNRALLPALLCLLPGTVALFAVPAQAAGAVSCSSAGLSFTQDDGGATYSIKVTKLRAKGATCTTARAIAGDVAKRDLAHFKVPKVSKGFSVSVVDPCTACSPNAQVSAADAGRVVTFTLAGGQ